MMYKSQLEKLCENSAQKFTIKDPCSDNLFKSNEVDEIIKRRDKKHVTLTHYL